MAQASGKKKTRMKPRFIFITFMLCICAICAALYSQNQKLRDIEAEKRALTEEYNELKNEEQRLEYMIEYAGTEEFLLQYAREKLGFVMPDDIKFDIQEAK